MSGYVIRRIEGYSFLMLQVSEFRLSCEGWESDCAECGQTTQRGYSHLRSVTYRDIIPTLA